MANIKEKIDHIRQAIFGKEVRESLASGLEEINKETEKTSKKQEDLETTFNDLIINAGNSNAEVVAARNGFETLGKRLDGVDSQLDTVTINHLSISVKDYGAKGDGVTDDITPIQNAINFVSSNGGGVVFIPNGTYIISSPIQMKSTVILKGESASSSVIITKSNTINAIESTGILVWSEICYLTIKSATKGINTNAIIFDRNEGATQCKIHDLIIFNFENGLYCGDNWYSNSVDNIRFWYSTNALKLIYNTVGVAIQNEIRNIYVHKPTGYALNISGFKRLSVYNLNIDTTSYPTGIHINTNSQVSIHGFNCEGSVLTNEQSIIVVRGGSNVLLENGQITPSSVTGRAYGLQMLSDNTNVTLLNCNISTIDGFRQVYTQSGNNTVLTNLSPLVTDIYNATGITSKAVVNNLNGCQTIVSPIIDLCATTEQNVFIAIPSNKMRIKSVKLGYTEWVTSETPVTVTVQWGSGNKYVVSSIQNEINKGKYTFTNGVLNNTLVESGVPLIATCPGGKGGTGKCQVIVEYWNE